MRVALGAVLLKKGPPKLSLPLSATWGYKRMMAVCNPEDSPHPPPTAPALTFSLWNRARSRCVFVRHSRSSVSAA